MHNLHYFTQSRDAADEIYELDIPIKDQLAAARAIENTAVRDATVSRLKTRHDEDKAIVEQARNQNLIDAYEIIDSGQDLDGVPSDLHDRKGN